MCPKSPTKSKLMTLRVRAARTAIAATVAFASCGTTLAFGQRAHTAPASTTAGTTREPAATSMAPVSPGQGEPVPSASVTSPAAAGPNSAVAPEDVEGIADAPSVAEPQVLPPPSAPSPPFEPEALAALLADAATDLGLVPERPPVVVVSVDDCTVVEEAQPAPGKVIIRGWLGHKGEHWWLRVSVTKDDATTHTSRVGLDDENYEVQAIRALALTVKSSPEQKAAKERQQVSPAATSVDTSQGKATLATHGAALGGYFGFALESAGGDVDTRLVYPLVALGAGVGLATALIVAEEWPVDRASAWYISGGGTWLTLAGVMVASELSLEHPTDRYPYGLIGTAVGLGVSTLVVSQRDVSEAEAVFSHSGAIFGALMGGFAQELIDPVTGRFPKLGVGIGTTGGWLLASLGTARVLPGITATRVLFADLGGFLGTLVGAAAASPAVVNQGEPRRAERRAFVGASLGGLVLGSVVGYWLGGSVDEVSESLPVSLRATTLGPTLASTPFEQGLPAATAFTLFRKW